MSTDNCMAVTPQCPVEATPYGYTPNLAGNVILCVFFGICTVIQIIFGIKGRTWTWALGLVLGSGLETAGYVGRILMNSNPWDSTAFQLQIIALILAPSFLAAGIDLTLKHLVIKFGTSFSLLKPALYTWLFIGLDVFCIVLQALGGGLASGDVSRSQVDIGNDLILAGISLQVVQLAAFGLISLFYGYRVLMARRKNANEKSIVISLQLRVFLYAIAIAYITILIRCIYRIPEMAGGWGKGLQRNEVDFMVLDGAMIAIAVLVLTIAHPTFCFPEMGRNRKPKQEVKVEEY